MYTVDEFEALLKSRREAPISAEKHLCIHLDGKWVWRYYKTYDTDFGWCISPADEKARAEMRKAESWAGDCFAKVYKKDGTFKEIRVPSRVYEENPNYYWFEYGLETLEQFRANVARINKQRKWKGTFIEFSSSDIPREWWCE